MKEAMDVYFSAQSFKESDVRGKTVVIIDILRASSTIATALDNGAKGIIPVGDMSSASKISQNLNSPNYLMAGEKDGVKIEGYDLGNSPMEYSPDAISGKTVILNTTNGTKAVKRSHLAKSIIIGSFLNLTAVVDYLKATDHETVLVCSGWRGRMALEDLLCAGNIIYDITSGKLTSGATDGARVAFGLYEKFGEDIEQVIRTSNYVKRLQEIVDEQDIVFCCQRDRLQNVPILKEGIITNLHGKEN